MTDNRPDDDILDERIRALTTAQYNAPEGSVPRDAMWAQMERELVKVGHDLTFSQFVTIKKLAGGIASVGKAAMICTSRLR